MEYIYVEWLHNTKNDPIILISELDENRYELRKIEIYKDGKVGFATKKIEFMDTRLAEVPIPSKEEIAFQDEFLVREITKDEFENYWNEHVSR
jgi:hypothetical protein